MAVNVGTPLLWRPYIAANFRDTHWDVLDELLLSLDRIPYLRPLHRHESLHGPKITNRREM